MSRRITYNSPVLPVEYPWKDGEEIGPCLECLPWRIEFFFRDEMPFVREWHAVDCKVLAYLDGSGPR